MQRTWDRIKSYLNTWIASWKTTNFGSGTYDNQLGLKISTDSSNYAPVEIKVDDELAICKLENTKIIGSYKITTYSGIAILCAGSAYNPMSRFTNSTDKVLKMYILHVVSSYESSYDVSVEPYDIDINETISTTNYNISLILWSA